jgi:hypothetical protein
MISTKKIQMNTKYAHYTIIHASSSLSTASLPKNPSICRADEG